MTISSTGVDRNGTLQVHIVVDGETPEFTSQDDIQVLNHKESFIQIGRGKLYGYTSKMILVNNQALPVAWNATINYQNERRMPYLVQSVSNEPFQMDYHVGEQAIRYGLRVYVSKGEERRDRKGNLFPKNSDSTILHAKSVCSTQKIAPDHRRANELRPEGRCSQPSMKKLKKVV